MLVSAVQGVENTPAATVSAKAQPAASAASASAGYYFSPVLVIDPKVGTAVLEYRNTSTGAVTNQYPSQKDIDAYAQHSLQPPVNLTTTASSRTQQPVSDNATATKSVVV